MSTSAATRGIGMRYASRKVNPSFSRLCSADKNTIEQQQHDPANMMHISAVVQGACVVEKARKRCEGKRDDGVADTCKTM